MQPPESAFNNPAVAVKRAAEIEAKNKIEEDAKKAEAVGKKYVAPEEKKDEKKAQKSEAEKKTEKQANSIVVTHETKENC